MTTSGRLENIASTGFGGVPVSFTRPDDTTAYDAGDVLGTSKTAGTSAAIEFTKTGPSGQRIYITSAALEVDLAAVPSGMTSFRLHLYNVTPPSVLVDGAAWDLPAGDRTSYLGYIDLGTPVDVGSTLYVQTDGINKQIKLSGTSLFGYLQTIGGYTPASQTVYKVSLSALAA